MDITRPSCLRWIAALVFASVGTFGLDRGGTTARAMDVSRLADGTAATQAVSAADLHIGRMEAEMPGGAVFVDLRGLTEGDLVARLSVVTRVGDLEISAEHNRFLRPVVEDLAGSESARPIGRSRLQASASGAFGALAVLTAGTVIDVEEYISGRYDGGANLNATATVRSIVVSGALNLRTSNRGAAENAILSGDLSLELCPDRLPLAWKAAYLLGPQHRRGSATLSGTYRLDDQAAVHAGVERRNMEDVMLSLDLSRQENGMAFRAGMDYDPTEDALTLGLALKLGLGAIL